jgi:hypothetical protein
MEDISNELAAQKYKNHLESMKKANKKYRDSHKEQILNIQKIYYSKHKDEEAFKIKQREKAKRSYHKRKEEKKLLISGIYI